MCNVGIYKKSRKIFGKLERLRVSILFHDFIHLFIVEPCVAFKPELKRGRYWTRLLWYSCILRI